MVELLGVTLISSGQLLISYWSSILLSERRINEIAVRCKTGRFSWALETLRIVIVFLRRSLHAMVKRVLVGGGSSHHSELLNRILIDWIVSILIHAQSVWLFLALNYKSILGHTFKKSLFLHLSHQSNFFKTNKLNFLSTWFLQFLALIGSDDAI